MLYFSGILASQCVPPTPLFHFYFLCIITFDLSLEVEWCYRVHFPINVPHLFKSGMPDGWTSVWCTTYLWFKLCSSWRQRQNLLILGKLQCDRSSASLVTAGMYRHQKKLSQMHQQHRIPPSLHVLFCSCV